MPLYENWPTLTPLLYSKTRVYRGIHHFFLFLLTNIDCEYWLEPPRQGGSNKYLQSMFWAEIWKICLFFFYLKIFIFLVVKFSVYLNRLVFIICVCVGGFVCGVSFVGVRSSSLLLWCLTKILLCDCNISWYFHISLVSSFNILNASFGGK